MYILPEQKNKYIEQIVELYSDLVYRLAITRTGNREMAEDVYQDVFYNFSRKLPEFESEEHTKAWFIRVTINCSKNITNSFWNRKVTTLDEDIKFDTPEKYEVFNEVLKLPKNYKTVIYLYYYEGYRIAEISKILNKKESTIKTWMMRAKGILKERLKGGFEDE